MEVTSTTTTTTSTTATSTTSQTEIILSSVPERSIVTCGSNDNVILMVSLKAPFFEESHRAAIDLMTVIDRSGSMEGEKIALVKDALKFVVRQLKSEDRLGIVVYDNEVSTPLPLTKMQSNGKEQADYSIKQISARGSTDLCSGLLSGIDAINKRQEQNKNEVSSVLLFTDGLANSGIQGADGIVSEMSKKAAPPTPTAPLGNLPCSVHTFGFGADHDVNILKAIADRGSGTYFFVQNKDMIADAFADCLGGLLSVVAQNITLEVKGVNGTNITQVKTAYPTKKEETHYTIAIGDIQSEEERDVLFIVSLPSTQTTSLHPVLHVKLSYFNVVTSKQEERECECFISRDDDLSQCVYELKVDRQKNRIIAADALAKAKTLGDAGDYKGAREALDSAKTTLKNSKSASDPFVVALVKDLDDIYSGLRDRETYQNYGNYQACTYVSSHTQQRATHSNMTYQTCARTNYRTKANEN